MSRKCMWIVWAVVLGLCVANISVYAAEESKEETAREGNWQISLRTVFRGSMRIGVDGSSYVQSHDIHAGNASQSSSSSSDSSYSDGFVESDVATSTDGMTWNFGYDNESQYDASANTLTFHASSRSSSQSQTLTTLQDDPLDLPAHVNGYGVNLAGSRSLINYGDLGIGFSFSLQGVWNQSAGFTASTFKEQVGSSSASTVTTYEYVYDTSGAIIPDPPYEGSYYGTGPQIAATPSTVSHFTRKSSSSSSSYEAANEIQVDVDTYIYTASLGPRIGYTLFKRLDFYVMPNMSVNYIDLSVDRSEVFVATYSDGTFATLGTWSNSESIARWRVGFGCEVGADVDVYKGWTLGAFGAYDWLLQDAGIEVGPNTVSVDGTGYTAGVEIGKKF